MMGMEVIGLAKSRRDVWSEAIEKAERDLARVEQKLEGWQVLMQRRDLLRATIENLKVLRGKVGSSPTEDTASSESSASKLLLWQAVYNVLKTGGKPRTASQVAGLLGVSGRNDREMVRQALNRKRALFEKLPDGRYALVEWQRSQGKLAILPTTKEAE